MILSFELPFALIPLLKFSSSTTKMGPHKNSTYVSCFVSLVFFFHQLPFNYIEVNQSNRSSLGLLHLIFDIGIMHQSRCRLTNITIELIIFLAQLCVFYMGVRNAVHKTQQIKLL